MQVCNTCDGVGAMKRSAIQKCTSCKGRGFRTEIRQVGPGMVQQIERECEVCNGFGETINKKDRCNTCGGKKVTREDASIDVTIPAGCSHGDQLKLRGAADEAPGEPSGILLTAFTHPSTQLDCI